MPYLPLASHFLLLLLSSLLLFNESHRHNQSSSPPSSPLPGSVPSAIPPPPRRLHQDRSRIHRLGTKLPCKVAGSPPPFAGGGGGGGGGKGMLGLEEEEGECIGRRCCRQKNPPPPLRVICQTDSKMNKIPNPENCNVRETDRRLVILLWRYCRNVGVVTCKLRGRTERRLCVLKIPSCVGTCLSNHERATCN